MRVDHPRGSIGPVLPIIVVSHAWLEAQRMSYADAAFTLDVDLQGAVPAVDGQRCPRCGKQPHDSAIRLIVPEPATETAERVEGRDTVQCLCGTGIGTGQFTS